MLFTPSPSASRQAATLHHVRLPKVAIAVLALFFALLRQYLRRADKRPSWCGAENTLTDRPCA